MDCYFASGCLHSAEVNNNLDQSELSTPVMLPNTRTSKHHGLYLTIWIELTLLDLNRQATDYSASDFGANRKRECDFLLIRHSNHSNLFLHRFRDIADFVLMAPPLFHSNFGGVPVGPDRRCWGQCEQVP